MFYCMFYFTCDRSSRDSGPDGAIKVLPDFPDCRVTSVVKRVDCLLAWLQMVEAEERQKVIHELTYDVVCDVMERGLVSGVECQRLSQHHLSV